LGSAFDERTPLDQRNRSPLRFFGTNEKSPVCGFYSDMALDDADFADMARAMAEEDERREGLIKKSREGVFGFCSCGLMKPTRIVC